LADLEAQLGPVMDHLEVGLGSLRVSPMAPPVLRPALEAVRRLLPAGIPFSVMTQGDAATERYRTTLDPAHHTQRGRGYWLARHEITARMIHQLVARYRTAHGQARGAQDNPGWLPEESFLVAAPLFMEAAVASGLVPRTAPLAKWVLG
jgi:hypothetical protein